jgi:tRNA(Ile)-lysidine synthase
VTGPADPAAAVRRALAGAGVAPGQTLLAAVSGGLDSTVLLHLLADLRERMGFRLHAAHLDHGLRGAAGEADAAFAAQTCRRLGVPLTAARRPVRPRPGESPEAAARRVRYRFLFAAARALGGARLVTAHHADDLAETVLMRMLAGAGSAGLAAMARPRPRVVRPLLGVPKAALRDLARARGIDWREDGSNADPRFARNRLRHEVLPALEAARPGAAAALCREARVLADEADYLARAAADALAPLLREAGNGATALDRAGLAALHPALARAGLARLLGDLVPGHAGTAHVEALMDLARGRTGRRADLPGGVVAEARYGLLVLARPGAPEADPLPGPVPLRVPGVTPVAWAGLALEARWRRPDGAPGWAYFDPAAFSGPLTVRPRVPGDRFRPAGMGGHGRSLKRLFIDRKVPRDVRERTPLVVAPEGILWVVGVRQDERFVVKGRKVPARDAPRPLALKVLAPEMGPFWDRRANGV